MNSQTNADDELLSSYLDDEATPGEVARIEADPTLRARVEELRAARDLVATPPVPLRANDVDRLVAAAIAASDTSPVVTDLAAVRVKRGNRIRTLTAIAAAVLLIALAVPVLNAIDLGGDGDQSAGVTTAADAPTEDGGDDGASTAGSDDMMLEMEGVEPSADASADASALSTADADAADVDAPLPSTADLAGGMLNSIEPVLDTDELLAAVRDRYDAFTEDEATQDAATRSLFTPEPLICADSLQAAFPDHEPILIDSAVLGVSGTSTVVALLELTDGEIVLAVAPIDDCEPVLVLDF